MPRRFAADLRRAGLLLLSAAVALLLARLVMLLFATMQNHRALQALRRQYGHVPRSLAAKLSILIAVLGLVGVVAVVFRL